VEGGLSEKTVRRIVEQNLPGIGRCLTGAGAVHSRLVLEWTIDRNGSAVNVRVSSPSSRDNTALDCIGRQIEKWSFPAPKDGRKVKVTLAVRVN
jgi:outer membrane biosynthesis protein TonB